MVIYTMYRFLKSCKGVFKKILFASFFIERSWNEYAKIHTNNWTTSSWKDDCRSRTCKKITGYKLLYNHMTIEMVRLIFDYDKEAFRKMNSIIRYEIFKEFSKSNEKGIIFTGCFDFGNNFEKEKQKLING